MFRIDPARVELAAEFKARPFGPHSGELQRVLNLMRSQGLPGRYALLTLVPHREWALIRLGTVRGGRFEIVEGVRQLQGIYAPDRQVRKAEVALVSGHGGNTVCHSTLILGRA